MRDAAIKKIFHELESYPIEIKQWVAHAVAGGILADNEVENQEWDYLQKILDENEALSKFLSSKV